MRARVFERLRTYIPILCLLCVVAFTKQASAYPWMIRHDYSGCTTCHADPSGGELLTEYGRAQGDLLLRMRYGQDNVSGAASNTSGTTSFESFDTFDESEKSEEKAPPKETKKETTEQAPGEPSSTARFLWFLDTPDWLLLGGSYRHALHVSTSDVKQFPMQLDLYGQVAIDRVRFAGTLGGARVPAGSPYARSAQITANQGDEWNLISRTHWVGVDLGSKREVTLRAGRLNLPFGLRIPEHTSWVRSITRTDRESSQQHGVAVAYNGKWLRGEAMGIAGNYQISPDKFRERGYSAYAEVAATDNIALGASSLFTVAQEDRTTLEPKVARGAHGGFARVTIVKPVVVLAEGDALYRSRKELGYVGFLQVDVEAVQGLHFGGTGEILDQGLDKQKYSAFPVIASPGYGEPRFGGWLTVDWFFLPHFELRVDGIARQRENLTLFTQLHVYL